MLLIISFNKCLFNFLDNLKFYWRVSSVWEVSKIVCWIGSPPDVFIKHTDSSSPFGKISLCPFFSKTLNPFILLLPNEHSYSEPSLPPFSLPCLPVISLCLHWEVWVYHPKKGLLKNLLILKFVSTELHWRNCCFFSEEICCVDDFCVFTLGHKMTLCHIKQTV